MGALDRGNPQRAGNDPIIKREEGQSLIAFLKEILNIIDKTDPTGRFMVNLQRVNQGLYNDWSYTASPVLPHCPS